MKIPIRPLAALLLVLAACFALGWAAGARPIGTAAQDSAPDPIPFTDAQRLTAQFMAYERNLRLTPEQEEVRRSALEPLPAACCNDQNAYTCCCPCNLSRAIWGLSKQLIVEHGWNAEQVRAKVKSWLEFVNPEGFPGDTCYTAGGCMKPFSRGGCGGMTPDRVVF